MGEFDGGVGSSGTTGQLHIRPMVPADVDASDLVMRRSFGSFFGVAQPELTFGEAQYVRTRFRSSPDDAFVALRGDEIVGSVFVARWGSFGFFGPLTVREDLWDQGIARQLMTPVMQRLREWGVSLAGLHTFAQSAKHVGFYQSLGFWP